MADETEAEDDDLATEWEAMADDEEGGEGDGESKGGAA